VFSPALERTGIRRFINILPARLVDPDGLNCWDSAGANGYQMADTESLERAGLLLADVPIATRSATGSAARGEHHILRAA
jgi:hypothetical protein